MTPKIPPGFDGIMSWFEYEQLVDDWVALTTIEPARQGPSLKTRLSGIAEKYKELLDNERLRDPDQGVEYFKRFLRPYFVKGVQHVYLYRFSQLQCSFKPKTCGTCSTVSPNPTGTPLKKQSWPSVRIFQSGSSRISAVRDSALKKKGWPSGLSSRLLSPWFPKAPTHCDLMDCRRSSLKGLTQEQSVAKVLRVGHMLPDKNKS